MIFSKMHIETSKVPCAILYVFCITYSYLSSMKFAQKIIFTMHIYDTGLPIGFRANFSTQTAPGRSIQRAGTSPYSKTLRLGLLPSSVEAMKFTSWPKPISVLTINL